MKKRKFKRFDEGGEVADKEAGLEASNKEKPVSLFQRLRMGNIDDPKSEAYKSFGAGRGRSERAAKVPVEDAVPTPVKSSATRAAEAEGEKVSEGERISSALANKPSRASSSDEKAKPRVVSKAELEKSGLSLRDFLNKERGLTRRKDSSPEPSKPKAEPAGAYRSIRSEVKTESIGGGRSGGRGGAEAGEERPSNRAKDEPKAKTDRKGTVEDIPGTTLPAGYTGKGEKVDSTELSRNINNALNAVVPGPARAVKGAAAVGRALEKAEKAETPLKFLGSSGRRQVGGFDEIEEATRKALSNEPLKLGMKRGGAVKKPVKKPVARYASGGSVSSASRRGDGIATKGKTKGRMI